MAKKVIPWELKYKYIRGMLTTLLKGFLYEIREEYGAAKSLEIYERVSKRDDRIKNMTNTVRDVFNIEGNDAIAIAKWFNIFLELTGIEATTLELSNTICRFKVTKCLRRTEPKDISGWCNSLPIRAGMTINPKATFENPKRMCAGDPYCELFWKIED